MVALIILVSLWKSRRVMTAYFFFFLAFAINVHLVPGYKDHEGVVPTASPVV